MWVDGSVGLVAGEGNHDADGHLLGCHRMGVRHDDKVVCLGGDGLRAMREHETVEVVIVDGVAVDVGVGVGALRDVELAAEGEVATAPVVADGARIIGCEEVELVGIGSREGVVDLLLGELGVRLGEDVDVAVGREARHGDADGLEGAVESHDALDGAVGIGEYLTTLREHRALDVEYRHRELASCDDIINLEHHVAAHLTDGVASTTLTRLEVGRVYGR